MFSFSLNGAEAMVTIVSLIETARANNADPYYYLKYLMDKMPKHLYDKGNGSHALVRCIQEV